MTGIKITGWGIAVPDKIVTNDDMAVNLDTSDAWIVERTGIRARHFAEPDVGASDLALQAARRALEAADVCDWAGVDRRRGFLKCARDGAH